MTVLEDLEAVKSRIAERLEELRPLVEEFQALQEAAASLEIDNSSRRQPARRQPAAPASPSKRRKPQATRPAGGAPARSTKSRKRPGRKPQRREQVLAFVRANPRTTVPAIAKDLGVDPTGLYRVVRQLEKDKALKKSGMELTATA